MHRALYDITGRWCIDGHTQSKIFNEFLFKTADKQQTCRFGTAEENASFASRQNQNQNMFGRQAKWNQQRYTRTGMAKHRLRLFVVITASLVYVWVIAKKHWVRRGCGRVHRLYGISITELIRIKYVI